MTSWFRIIIITCHLESSISYFTCDSARYSSILVLNGFCDTLLPVIEMYECMIICTIIVHAAKTNKNLRTVEDGLGALDTEVEFCGQSVLYIVYFYRYIVVILVFLPNRPL